ncbi:MAG TPA: carbamoyltransferase HypF [Gammaproteobacteria bacterium]|nr:carbamoyltransferase HypF [Gammaproteobacteria bacterium]
MLQRIQIQISGQVQGVGFRPYIYQIAQQLKLSGWVRNDAQGITLQAQGHLASKLPETLLANLPTLAKIHSIKTCTIPLIPYESDFAIISSEKGQTNTIIPPDAAICADCLSELFDRKSRFYHYPFLNCSHCGPRLTIAENLPYDRHDTAMKSFALCAPCQQDYHNPENRRYHAEPIACPACGPQFSNSIENIASRIKQGEIIAIKGIGGYQLILDAHNEKTIARLRARKQRKAKPLALMMLNVSSIQLFAEYNSTEEKLLTSPMRPIVLLRKKVNSLGAPSLSNLIAPDLAHIGVMLPYTAFHYLLFHALSAAATHSTTWLEEANAIALIVTSANTSGNPLIIEDIQATQELTAIADDIVAYNRPIVTRADDSVLKIINQTPFFIRRARGFVPTSIPLACAIPSTLAVGAYLKNTICITRNDEAFLSQHIGDLNNKSTIQFFHETIHHLLKFLNVRPECIGHDSHPDLYSSRFAEQYGLPTLKILHHHAHLAATAAEHHIQEPVLGLALDGHGYGILGENWGGELMLLKHTQCQHLAGFKPLPLPGGEQAAKQPWRMGVSALYSLGFDSQTISQSIQHADVPLLIQLLKNSTNIPLTSSCGRLFDAACALLGVHLTSQYEGQAAMKLESLVTKPQVLPQGWLIEGRMLNLLPLLKQLITLDAMTGANLFHGTLIAALHDWVVTWSKRTHMNTVLLSGGCFLNKILTEGLVQLLTASHIKVLFSKKAPPNDAGISLGQAWIAGLSCV